MPELPEVEARLRHFLEIAPGKVIDRVHILEHRLIKCPGVASFRRELKGATVTGATRRGKYLLVSLKSGACLILHFGMGGDIYFYRHSNQRPGFTRIEFVFRDGARLGFTCPRNICRVLLVSTPGEVPALRSMGPEPLERAFSLKYFLSRIRRSPSRRIKPMLMDQSVVAGVGNIYADEILFAAGVRGYRRAGELTDEEARRIHAWTRRVLRKSIATAGDEDFPNGFLVSRMSRGEGCPRCGAELVRTRLAGRTTHHCPKCQR